MRDVLVSTCAEGDDKDDKSGQGDKFGRCMHTYASTDQRFIEMVAHVPTTARMQYVRVTTCSILQIVHVLVDWYAVRCLRNEGCACFNMCRR